MRVNAIVSEDEVESDSGRAIDGLTVTCERCGHSVEVFGTDIASAERGAVMLREECPHGEKNFYVVNW